MRSKRARAPCATSSEVVVSPGVAGVELASAAVRVVVGHRESGRFKVTGVGRASIPASAMSGGYIADRRGVGAPPVTAFAHAAPAPPAEKVLGGHDRDGIRPYPART